MLETLKVQKLDRRAKLTQAHEGDAGYDLSCLDGFKLDGGERALIGTGLAIELPEGYAAFVMSRSGLARKYGVIVANAPGIVDSGFRGELGVILYNSSLTPIRFNAGDRIAQLVIQKVETPRIMFVTTISHDTERGDNGFGSTGVA